MSADYEAPYYVVFFTPLSLLLDSDILRRFESKAFPWHEGPSFTPVQKLIKS
jgi:hypothetical protein